MRLGYSGSVRVRVFSVPTTGEKPPVNRLFLAPSSVQGIVQGLLPPVLLAALFATMPVILRGVFHCFLPSLSL